MAKKSLFSVPLVRELMVVLLIKLVLIFAIRIFWFSDPVDMTNPQDAVSQQFGLSTITPSQSEDQQ
ncbi:MULTISPECIES: cytochrome oxidase putative small subunit CydP [unclassified Thalassolituus]|jgi:hypothetical protein|uniref:cytochrome oxidase putative small subunit CydP n=1 Tax=Oceanospirillaceae TaxID=135620 RepID=UPI000C43E915|nr:MULTISPECIES: cytochrome oxidase putative small subunit CydP [unclassified Thalassolituus]MAY14171.1 hypothetical protein [Oceanospirillaceae bacterium]MBU2038878.1 hypothetical protein [Gammaproteobacteria bacterium]PIQ39417.1 MAG: hypothetical protein COW58_11650 [Thalassolituus sp. CG17_big_fil_post_rev_8_21_14_2_50_53_8]MCA6061196.1 hypothetical protein [Thalassolituus sp. ST750PaO-4]TVV45997.1 hypothetical protein FOT50_03970 [Thalassolituus sp. C2-1]